MRILAALVDLAQIGLVAAGVATVVLVHGSGLTGQTAIAVVGRSMEPAIGYGTLLFVEAVPPPDLSIGDVISLRGASDRAMVTHRIVRIVDRADGPWFETRGDANAAPDPVLVPAGAVIGRVGLVVPAAGEVLIDLARPGGLLVLAGLAGLLFAAGLALDRDPGPREPRPREPRPREPGPRAPGAPQADPA
jgi:signal peptidase